MPKIAHARAGQSLGVSYVGVRKRHPYISPLADVVCPEHPKRDGPIVSLFLVDHVLIVEGIELLYPERAEIETKSRFEFSHSPARHLAASPPRNRGDHTPLIRIPPEPRLRLVDLRCYATLHIESGGGERHPASLITLVPNGDERVSVPRVRVEAKVPIGAQQRGVSGETRVAARNGDTGPVPEAPPALQQPLPSA